MKLNYFLLFTKIGLSCELKKKINHEEVWNSVIIKRLMQAHIGQN